MSVWLFFVHIFKRVLQVTTNRDTNILINPENNTVGVEEPLA